ncbi:uncharacterized protein LOC142335076 [Convolutriloba macropyga]|uniref:uncharacterized protein LOC142335076 n=1 Tax=Convolutriloba macropyga TaxID=536237 RepID=UPI003F523DA3
MELRPCSTDQVAICGELEEAKGSPVIVKTGPGIENIHFLGVVTFAHNSPLTAIQSSSDESRESHLPYFRSQIYALHAATIYRHGSFFDRIIRNPNDKEADVKRYFEIIDMKLSELEDYKDVFATTRRMRLPTVQTLQRSRSSAYSFCKRLRFCSSSR